MILATVSPTKRALLIFGSLTIIAALLLVHTATQLEYFSWNPSPGLGSTAAHDNPYIRRRVDTLRRHCKAPNSLETEYGRTNLRLSRAYEGKSRNGRLDLTSGSHYGLRKLLHKTLRGEPIIISAIGGSSEVRPLDPPDDSNQGPSGES